MDDIKPAGSATTPDQSPAMPQAGGMVSPSAAPTMDDTISPEGQAAGPVAPPSSPEPSQGQALAPQPAPADSSTPTPGTQNPMAAPQQGAPKKKRTGLVIVVATVVALALAGAAYYAYMKTMKHDDKPAAKQTTQSTTATITPAKATDVDSTSQELDKSLATTNDNKDFAATDLADATLGL